MTIRRATPDDAPAFAAILNYYIEHTTSTLHGEPYTIEDRRVWLQARTEAHPAFVLEDGNGEIIGVSALFELKARTGYRHTVENMVYLRQGHHGKGYGKQLLEHLIAAARAYGHHAIVAAICSEQGPSLHAHQSVGFEKVGHLRQVGRKFDRWLDIVYMEKLL